MRVHVCGLLLAVATASPALAQVNQYEGYWRQQHDLEQLHAYQAQEAERRYQLQMQEQMFQQQLQMQQMQQMQQQQYWLCRSRGEC